MGKARLYIILLTTFIVLSLCSTAIALEKSSKRKEPFSIERRYFSCEDCCICRVRANICHKYLPPTSLPSLHQSLYQTPEPKSIIIMPCTHPLLLTACAAGFLASASSQDVPAGPNQHCE